MGQRKLPAIQFYTGDWKKDIGVQSLTMEERGVWMELLILMHESEERGKLVLNGRPYPVESLAMLCGFDVAKLQQTLSKLLANGVASIEQNTGVIFSRRMLRDEHLRQVRASCGHLGGKQKSSKALANTLAKATPSSSSSSSSSASARELSKDNSLGVSKRKFTPPTIDEVHAYCLERQNAVPVETFMAHYESNGWKVGKNPMKDWRAAVRTWEKNHPKPSSRLPTPEEDARWNPYAPDGGLGYVSER